MPHLMHLLSQAGEMWNMSSHEAKRPATVQSEDFWLIRVSCASDAKSGTST